MTTKNKILAYTLAIILLVVSTLLYFDVSYKGFPDGHLNELDRAEQPLFFVSSNLCLVLGLFLLYLARFKKTANTNRIFYRTLLFLLLAFLIIVVLDKFLIETLNDGRGG